MSDPAKDFKSELEQAFDKAFKSAKGGDVTWNEFIKTYGIAPLGDKEKEFLLKSDMKIATGAFPIELRRVFQVILAKYAAVAATAENAAVLTLLNNYNIDVEVIRYYNRIKPFTGMSDIFKNAKSTTKNYSEGIGEARKSAHRCKSCGAPRLEEMQYDECLFCGSELFVPNN
jgi:hypothetical protein